MARLMLIGKVAQVELTVDNEGYAIATCRLHPSVKAYGCGWTVRLDNITEMIHSPYAEAHADRGTR